MVLVCHPHRFIFMKTRKTAGTSIEMYLERFCVPEEQYTGTEAIPETVTDLGVIGSRLEGRRPDDKWYNHMPASQVLGLLGRERWDSYLKIASVRNPFPRVLSQFLWQTKKTYPSTEAEFARLKAEFTRFVKGGWFSRRRWTNDLDIVGIDGRPAMDVLIRQEHLSEDVEALCARLGIPWNPDWLPHTKKIGGGRSGFPIATYYTPRTREIVEREFAWLLSRTDYRMPETATAE